MASDTAKHKMRVRVKDGVSIIKMLLQHPMETGARKDSGTGLKVPRYFIRELTCEYNGKPVLRTQWSWGMARNPYLSIRVKNGRSGDHVRVSWVDNMGESESIEATAG